MRKVTLVTVGVALALAGCGGGGGSSETGTAEDYYSSMKIGKFKTMTEDQVDKIGKSYCADMKKSDMTDEIRKASVMVIRESVDTDAEAVLAVRAMTKRWCPEFTSLFK